MTNKKNIFKNIYTSKEELYEQRKQFWNKFDEPQKCSSNDTNELYDLFSRSYPRANEKPTKYDWISFKKGLSERGIEYISKTARKANANELINQLILKKGEKVLKLYVASNWKEDRFAILDKDQKPIWYGKSFNKFESSFLQDLDAAKKAIWIANELQEHFGIKKLVLELYVMNGALVYDKPSQKAYELKDYACSKNIALKVIQLKSLSQSIFNKYLLSLNFKTFELTKQDIKLFSDNPYKLITKEIIEI